MRNSSTYPKRDIKHYQYIIWIFWFIFLFIIFLSYNPTNPFVSFNVKKNLVFMLPQGWGFFTKNPREALIEAYGIKNNELYPITINNFSPENYFGLSRKARYAGYELAKLFSYIPKEAYENKIGELYTTFPEKATVINIPFHLENYPENEDFIIYQYKLIPYSWMNEGQEKYRPYIQARIKLKYSSDSKHDLKKYFEENK